MNNPFTLEQLNKSMTTGAEVDSVHHYLERTIGEPTTKTITLSANNTTASENIFQITGSVQIYRIYGEITDATTLANLTAASFDLYDSTAAVQMTAAGGVLSGMGVGTNFFKSGLAANNFDINNNAAGAITEQTYEGSDVFSRCIVTQKTGANTYIRFTYTTTDTPINAQIKFYVEYFGLDGSGTLVAA